MVKRPNILILFSIFATLGVLFILPRTSSKPKLSYSAPIASPEPIAFVLKDEKVVSPDMKHTLYMKTQKNLDSVTYSFSTQSEKEERAKSVYETELPSYETLSIPFNTWAPENKYFFVKFDNNEKHIVISSTGKPLPKNYQTVNVEELFAEKFAEYKITAVTGWAGPTLLVINTDKLDGTIGPSFWLDMSTLSFIKLSTRFN